MPGHCGHPERFWVSWSPAYSPRPATRIVSVVRDCGGGFPHARETPVRPGRSDARAHRSGVHGAVSSVAGSGALGRVARPRCSRHRAGWSFCSCWRGAFASAGRPTSRCRPDYGGGGMRELVYSRYVVPIPRRSSRYRPAVPRARPGWEAVGLRAGLAPVGLRVSQARPESTERREITARTPEPAIPFLPAHGRQRPTRLPPTTAAAVRPWTSSAGIGRCTAVPAT